MNDQQLERFCEAAKVGFDELDRGEGIEIESAEDLDRLLDELEAGQPADAVIARRLVVKK
jgi:hypothetical protein